MLPDDVLSGLRSSYDGRRVLVTGGASFIGSHLVELLVALGAAVVVVDDLSSGRIEHLASCVDRVDIRLGDARDAAVLGPALDGVDTVFHLAARHGGRGYIDDHPVACIGNAALDHDVFRAAAHAGARHLVFTSSACVYPVDGGQEPDELVALREEEAGPDERGAAFADGEYGWAKLYGELQLRAFAKEYAMSATACRLFNAYGQRQNESHAMIAIARRVVGREDPFLVWGDGSQRRSFTYVADVAVGVALAGTIDEPGFRALNVGAADSCTIDELCELLFELEGWRPTEIVHDLGRPIGSNTRVADPSRLRDRFGWQPDTDLRTGVERTLRHLRREGAADARQPSATV